MNFFKKNSLLFRFIGWYFLANTLVFWVLGYGYLSSTFASTSLFQNSVIDYSHYFPGRVLVLLFMLVNYLSHMMLLAFIPGLFIFLLACIAPSKRFIILVSVLAAFLAVVCLVSDSHVYAMFKFHMNTTLLAFIFSSQWREVFDFSRYELQVLSSATAAVLVIESIIAWIVWKKIILVGRFKVGKTIAIFWLSAALFTYFTLMLSIAQNNNLFSQQTINLPLFNQLFVYVVPGKNAQNILARYSEQHFAQPLFPNDPMHYPLHPLRCQSPDKPYNIILIMVDSLRFDSMQSSYMPNVTEFGKKGWQFQNHMSGGNATQPGVFSLFYGIPSNYWTAALKQKKKPVFMDLLARNGYSTRVIWSMEMLNPPFHKTVFADLTDLPLNGAPGDDVGNWDRDTTKKALQFLTSQQPREPFFLHLFYNAPHGFCREQSFASPFQPTLPNCSRMSMGNNIDPLPYYNRYLNSVKFVDEEIGKVLSTIEKQGYLKNSIVVFTSDHGQEFNDNHQNYWGHCGNFTKAQVQIPLIIYWPGEKPRQMTYLTTAYDVSPTLLTRLFSCKNSISDYSIGQSLLTEQGRLPFILMGSYINMGIVEPSRITTLERSGRVSITDTKAEPLPNAMPNKEVIHQALALMRKYF
ncbi:MAG: DUF3413 domain-containing protein [Legionellales bacterium]|nr:DUF3413 domain-containing protein [Legionellales bacterium]